MAKNKKKKHIPAPAIKRSTSKKEWAILGVIIAVLIGISVSAVILFKNKVKSTSGDELLLGSPSPTPYLPTLERMKNAINVDIKVNKDSIEPSEVTLDKDTDYNFRIIKFPGSECRSLKNNLLDYSLELLNTASSYPIRIPTAGEYKLECDGQDLTLRVKVQ